MTPYRDCWRLAWPLILSNLSVPLLGLVDTAVVGHLPSPDYLGAVALGSMLIGVIYFLFGFLRMGTTALTSQAFGAGDVVELRYRVEDVAPRNELADYFGEVEYMQSSDPIASPCFAGNGEAMYEVRE